MQLIEKIKPSGINTDIHPESVEQGNQGNRRLINPVVDALNKHYFTSEDSDGERAQNVRGNALKANSLPSGTNVCIGSYEDKLNNELIFWNYNSNGSHGVYAYSPETDTIRTIIVNSALNFQNDRRYLITGTGSIGPLIYWSDGINPQRVINRTRDYTYLTFSIYDITVIKRPPLERVTVGETYTESQNATYDRAIDANIKVNSISDNSFQFSYRFQYLDNEYSVIAAISEISLAEWEPDPFNNRRTRIQIQLYGIPPAANNFIKTIELLVRRNNEEQWAIFETIKSPNTFSFGTWFTGMDNVIPIDQISTSKLFESVPNQSKALVTHRNRLFLSADTEGFDVGTEPTLAITETPYTNIGNKALANGQNVFFTLGLKTITLTTSAVYAIGEMVEIVRNGVSPAQFLRGKVTASAGTSVTISVGYVQGSGSFTTSGLITASVKQLPLRYHAGTGALEQNGDWSLSYWKTNSSHFFGLAVFDAEQRSMGIVSKTKYTASPGIKPTNLPNSDVLACAKDILLDVVIAGNFASSPKVRYVSLCVTEDQTYQTYQQVGVKVLFYVGEYITGAAVHAGQYIMGNKLFTRTLAGGFNSIYLLLPLNLSIDIDTSFYVRPMSIPGVTNWVGQVNKVESVINGNMIQVDKFGLTEAQLTALANNDQVTYTAGGSSTSAQIGRMVVEIFKPRETKSNDFFEITKRYPVDVNGIIPAGANQSRLQGFTYRPQSNLEKNPTIPRPFLENEINMIFTEPLNIVNFAGTKVNVTFKVENARVYNPEIPSPTIGIASNIRTPTVFGTLGSTTPDIIRGKIVTPDYTKIADNRGKPLTELIERKELPRPSVVRYSDKYVQDTNVNGLSSFNFESQYPLDYNRGGLTKFVSAGTRILAIHERATSVVYTEEKMIRNSDGGEQLIAATEAIGYDQQLSGGYGSYHPESVQSVDNMVFAFDVYKGCVWRYTQEGQFPVSDYGRKTLFRDLAQSILENKATTKIVAGIDPFHKEYIITIAGQTHAFNYVENKWTTRYSFLPEMYGTIGQQMVTFKNGALWLHNSNPVHNNFYGVQYESFVKIAMNAYPTRVKVAQAIQLAMEQLSDDDDYQQIVVTTDDGQSTHTPTYEFELREGVFYAPILKDENTQSDTIPGQLALRQGDDMRAKVLYLQINDDSTNRNSLQMANFVYQTSEFSE